MSTIAPPPAPPTSDFDAGRRVGLAIGALSASLFSFLTLLGVEKAILAIVLATLAMRGTGPGAARRLGRLACGIAALYVLCWAGVLLCCHRQVVTIVHLLHQLG